MTQRHINQCVDAILALDDEGQAKATHHLIRQLELSSAGTKLGPRVTAMRQAFFSEPLKKHDQAVSNWERDEIQFPRLIEELQGVGAFTPSMVRTLCESMDLKRAELFELLERASVAWEKIKAKPCTTPSH